MFCIIHEYNNFVPLVEEKLYKKRRIMLEDEDGDCITLKAWNDKAEVCFAIGAKVTVTSVEVDGYNPWRVEIQMAEETTIKVCTMFSGIFLYCLFSLVNLLMPVEIPFNTTGHLYDKFEHIPGYHNYSNISTPLQFRPLFKSEK